jgi:arylsulfatase A-like enzyme
VTAADVIPTLLGRLELRAFDALLSQASGRDVLTDGARSAVTSQDTGRLRDPEGYRYAITTERWKLFEIERRQGPASHLLFDLQADPFELTDVSTLHPEVTAQLASDLRATVAAQRERGAILRAGEEPTTTPPDPHLREQLKALGYVEDESSPH